jgi:hypothetical protein
MTKLNFNTMKNILFTLILLSTSFLSNAQQAAISLPEMSILYKGWDNKVVPSVGCNDSIILEVSDGTATKAKWTDADGNEYDGFLVNITGQSKFVTLTLFEISKDGQKLNRGSFKYKVKAFPRAQLQGTTISKTVGFKAVVSLGPDSPFTGVSYQVIGGSVIVGNDEIVFSGDIVPASYLEKTKPGKTVAMDVTYKVVGSSEIRIATGILTVVP